MKNYKRAAAGILAVISAFAAASCGSKSSSSSSSSFVETVDVKESADITPIPEGADGTLEWCSYFDLNPTRANPEKTTALSLFEQNGGSIEYYRTSSLDKYDKLAARLLSNDPPDMFWYEMKMTFPANCIKEMFQPVDDIVDFDSAMWSDVKDVAENFSLNGKHFVAPINFLPSSVIAYDCDVIEANGLEDPYQLYLDGKWDWNAWYDMMDEYVHNAEDEEERYGINGWFAPFIFHSTGKTLIKLDNEKNEFVSNIDDPDFARATDLLYDIQKNGFYYPDWIGQTGDAFQKNILFYAMGPWATTGNHGPGEGQNWAMVPIPKDPNCDTLYTTVDMQAYMWVNGSTKKDAMKCWLECARIVYTQEEYIETEREKFAVNNPTWTDQMYDVAYVEPLTDKFTRVFDPGYGISTILSDDDAATNDTREAVIPYLYTSVMKTDDNGTQFTWAQLKEQYSGTIDSELKIFNAAYKEFLEK